MIRLPFYLCVCLMLTGCATILNDPEQPVAFDSEPASAYISIDGVRMGTTPCVVPVARKGGDKLITFELQGYKTEIVKMPNTLDAALAGNILLGGFVGLAIDGVSGRGGGYQKSLKIIMEPGSGTNDRSDDAKATKSANKEDNTTPANSPASYAPPATPNTSDFELSIRAKSAAELNDLAHFYEELLRVEPNGIGARRNLAMVRYQQGQYEQAWQQVKYLRLLGTSVPGDFETRLAAAMPEP